MSESLNAFSFSFLESQTRSRVASLQLDRGSKWRQESLPRFQTQPGVRQTLLGALSPSRQLRTHRPSGRHHGQVDQKAMAFILGFVLNRKTEEPEPLRQ